MQMTKVIFGFILFTIYQDLYHEMHGFRQFGPVLFQLYTFPVYLTSRLIGFEIFFHRYYFNENTYFS